MKNFIILFLVKLGFSKLTAAQKVAKANAIIGKLTGNPDFPVVDPPLTDVIAATHALADAVEKAEDGNYAHMADKREKEKALEVIMSKLQSDINTKANGDPVKILNAGFEVRSNPTPIGLLGPVVGVSAVPSLTIGEVNVKWPRMLKTRLYIIQASTDPAFVTWHTSVESTKSKKTISGLTSGQVWYFRVACVTAAGAGPWSELAACKVL